jgi:hypothetical protein
MMNTGCEAGESAIKFARRWAYTVKGVPENEAIVIYLFFNKSVCSHWATFGEEALRPVDPPRILTDSTNSAPTVSNLT